MQRDAEVQQDQGEPDYGHGERPVAIRGVEECENGNILVGILGRLQLVLEVVGQGNVIPPRYPLNKLSQRIDASAGQQPPGRLRQVEPTGNVYP